MISPAPLKEGDTIAIVSPAGALRDAAVVERCRSVLESWGLNVYVAPHALASNGYYSGTQEERLNDFAQSLADVNIKAILCSYGGYGCVHLLDGIAPLIAKQPKWIIGMSDCSALHAASLSQGVMSLHSPQCRLLSEFPDSIPAKTLKEILFGARPTCTTAPHSLDIQGRATGVLAGGNLSVLTALAGSRYDIFKEGTILFIEDTGEQPYRVERMMYQLELSGALSKLKGIIVGEFNGVNDDGRFGGTTYELIHNIVSKYGIPVCFGFPVGHCNVNMPLIEGEEVELSVLNDKTILEYK